MKGLIFLVTALILFLLQDQAQEPQAKLLTVPADWKFERLDFPLEFAPDLDYRGFEELRFAPGMYDTASPNYLTYLYAMEIEGHYDFNEVKIKKFLSGYYRGLSYTIAKSKDMDVDTSLITVSVHRPGISTGRNDNWVVTLKFIDSFTFGQEVTLNMEVVVLHAKNKEKTYIQNLISPQPKQSAVWKELFSYRKTLMAENPVFSNLRKK